MRGGSAEIGLTASQEKLPLVRTTIVLQVHAKRIPLLDSGRQLAMSPFDWDNYPVRESRIAPNSTIHLVDQP